MNHGGRPDAAGTRTRSPRRSFRRPPRAAPPRTTPGSPRRRPGRSAVCEDHFGREEVVDAQSVQAGEPAHPTAQGQSTDAGVAHQAERRRQAVFLSRPVHVTQQGSAAHPGAAVLGGRRGRCSSSADRSPACHRRWRLPTCCGRHRGRRSPIHRLPPSRSPRRHRRPIRTARSVPVGGRVRHSRPPARPRTRRIRADYRSLNSLAQSAHFGFCELGHHVSNAWKCCYKYSPCAVHRQRFRQIQAVPKSGDKAVEIGRPRCPDSPGQGHPGPSFRQP